MRTQFHGLSLALCAALLATSLGAAPADPPPLPPPPAIATARMHHLSPVEYFRLLLGMNAAERERILASRSPADRKIILAKIQEYEAMPRDMREARLCQTELHWELGALMRLAPADRTARLREVSPLYRPMMEVLLEQWDKVPARTQKDLLERQDFIGLYLRVQDSNSAAAQKEILAQLSPDRRARWTEEMGRWQALPQEERADLCAQFQRFCLMNGDAQKETAGPLSPFERRAMDNALQTFNRLPPAQRNVCMNSFRKFATMAPEERAQFLQNAARWQSMTVHERQLWRRLVQTLPPMPPLPPGVQPLPPMPPAPLYTRAGRAGRLTPPMPPNVITPVIIALSPNDVR